MIRRLQTVCHVLHRAAVGKVAWMELENIATPVSVHQVNV